MRREQKIARYFNRLKKTHRFRYQGKFWFLDCIHTFLYFNDIWHFWTSKDKSINLLKLFPNKYKMFVKKNNKYQKDLIGNINGRSN